LLINRLRKEYYFFLVVFKKKYGSPCLLQMAK